MIVEEQQEYIEKNFKIPLDADCPGFHWIISLSRDSIMPSEEELRQLQSYQEFSVRRTYNRPYQETILKRHLPRDPGHNTVIFKKSEHGWVFRRFTWRSPFFFPSPIENKRPLALVEVINKIEDIIPEKWERWKQEHPEIFPLVPDAIPPAE